MKELGFTLSFFALILAAAFALSCGSNGQGQLQAITLSPQTAEGQAHFTATGHYVNPTHTVTPQSATWGVCYQGAPTADVTVTSAGAAQCASGAVGDYTVFAYDITNPACAGAINACGGGCTIVGTGQLTCP